MREHKTNWQQIDGEIPPISAIVVQRIVRFAGHCCRAEDQVISAVYYVGESSALIKDEDLSPMSTWLAGTHNTK